MSDSFRDRVAEMLKQNAGREYRTLRVSLDVVVPAEASAPALVQRLLLDLRDRGYTVRQLPQWEER